MEGWQKGAGAVLKMSGAGKENYFKNFPERKASKKLQKQSNKNKDLQ